MSEDRTVQTEATPATAPEGTTPPEAVTSPDAATAASGDQTGLTTEVLKAASLSVYYGKKLAVQDVEMAVPTNKITALIGPSGCGKSTILRCFNRMNDLVKTAWIDGKVLYHGQDLYGKHVDPVEVRKRIGQVFQQPNPFPKSIYDNVAFGPRVLKMKVDMDEVVERCLRQAAIWDEVKDRLKTSALSLSGGQQQRLCIARALATNPDVLLMDEPCSALDPVATAAIEELMKELRGTYTIVIVTHNMQQAVRVSDKTAFFTVEVPKDGERYGVLAEYDDTMKIFNSPSDDRTKRYISGEFG
jgi:phosphate transport system ATP-binding protein